MDLRIIMKVPRFRFDLNEFDVNPSEHKMHLAYIKLWNRGFISLSALFLLISLCDFLFISSEVSCSFFLLAVFFFYMLFTDLKFNKLAQVFTFLFVSFVLFYVSSHIGIGAGIYLYYVPLIFSLPVFLNLKTDKPSIILICFFMFFELFYNFAYNKSTHPRENLIFIASLIGTFLFISWVVYFVWKVQYLKMKHYREKIAIRTAELEIDYKKLNEIIEMAKRADRFFLEKFKLLYPHFCERLVEMQPSIVPTELEFCAYLKLNFTTKDIARYTNSSIRSVEGKKYRIRKKFDIPERIDIYLFMSNI